MSAAGMFVHLTSKERYHARKNARLCVDCEAPLPVFGTGVRCNECRDRNRASTARYKTADPARRAAQLKRSRVAADERNPGHKSEVRKARDDRRAAAGPCLSCPAPAQRGHKRCLQCRRKNAKSALAWFHRNKGKPATATPVTATGPP